MSHTEAKEHLVRQALLIPDIPVTLQDIATTVLHISQLAKVQKPIAMVLMATAIMIRQIDDEQSTRSIVDGIMMELGPKIDDHINKLSSLNDSLDAEVGSLHSAIDDLSNLKTQQTTLEETIQLMESSAAKVTNSTSNLTDTTTSYRDALINAAKAAPMGSPLLDPQVMQKVLTQAKQILIDTGTTLPPDTSTTALHEQAQNALFTFLVFYHLIRIFCNSIKYKAAYIAVIGADKQVHFSCKLRSAFIAVFYKLRE